RRPAGHPKKGRQPDAGVDLIERRIADGFHGGVFGEGNESIAGLTTGFETGSLITTSAPALPSARAIARSIPELAPVTRAVCPFNNSSCARAGRTGRGNCRFS